MKRGRILLASLLVGITVLGVVGAAPKEPATGVPELRQLVTDLQQQVLALQGQVGELQQKLQFVTVVGTEMYITGANLNVRDGSGTTSGTALPFLPNPTGLGNLIIGYNENGVAPCSGCLPQPVRERTGSHNLVIGVNHGYTSVGGFVAGYANSIANIYAAISGGAYNTSSGMFSMVSGGEMNVASAEGASVSGGSRSSASGRFASVSGGAANNASEEEASVSGGSVNTASGLFSSVSGGAGNGVSGQNSSISGGSDNVLDTQFAWAAGSLHSP